MATPYDRVRLVMSGTIATSQSWSCGLTCASLTTAGGNMNSVDQAALNDFANEAVTVIRKFWNTAASGTTFIPKTILSQTTLVTDVTAYKYEAGSDTAALVSTPAFGAAIAGTGTSPHPSQTSVVASLRTTTPGRRGRGRIYLPATGAAMDLVPLQFLPTLYNGLATDVARLIHDVSVIGLGQDDSTVVVGSQFGSPRVTFVEVDSRPDVQRRRADKIEPLGTGSVTVPAS